MKEETIKEIVFNFLLAILISTFIFALYVELSPKLTNIWYRINSNGIRTIQLQNLFTLMMGPLKYDFYWYPSYFDINYFVYLFIIFILLEIINQKAIN